MSEQQKSRGGFSSFIASLCIIIYLFALTQAIIRIYFSTNEQQNIAEKEFSHIATAAFEAGLKGFMDEQFKETINNVLKESSSFEALIISGSDGEYEFEKQPGLAVTYVNNIPRFKNNIGFSKQPHFKSFPLNDYITIFLYVTNCLW